MKKALKFLGVAALAMTVISEKAEAFDIATSFGPFTLGNQMASTDDPRGGAAPATYVNFDDFRLVDGSFRTAEGGLAPTDVGFNESVDGGFGPLNRITGAVPSETVDWWGDGARAFEYAYAFALQLITPSAPPLTSPDGTLNNFLQKVDTTPAAFAFAYETTGTLGSTFSPLSVNSMVVAVNDEGVADLGTSLVNFGNVSISLVAFSETQKAVENTNIQGSSIDANLVYAVSSKKFGFEEVPEIDGPVLVQVGFALMGLYVLMLGRRRREDEVSGTPLAA